MLLEKDNYHWFSFVLLYVYQFVSIPLTYKGIISAKNCETSLNFASRRFRYSETKHQMFF